MKKSIYVLTAVLGLLVLGACKNPFAPPSEFLGRDIPAGKGIVSISTGTGAARTAIPEAVFNHYEYWFSHNGGTAVKLDPVEEKFELDAGTNWTVTVKAFAGPGADSLAAEGSSEAFAVIAGQDMGSIAVALHPVVSEGAGTLAFSLEYPAGVTVDSFTLTLLADVTSIDLTSTNGAAETGTDPLTYSGQETDIPAGYYLARGVLKKGTIASGKSEVVHIYKNLSTPLTWTFTEDNFKAIRVYSSADSGAGSLREALTNAAAGDTIFVDLPEGGRVISLTSRLPEINKNLTIEGNGVTLLGSGIQLSENSQIMYMSDGEVTIRRVHFRDGTSDCGAAIWINSGTLNLESCIFSGNGVLHIYGEGGAIANQGTLAVSGCTFYGNSSAYGGAIYNFGALSLTGNLFYGNTASHGSKVVYPHQTVNSGGYNVSDASGTNIITGSGWNFTTGDKQISALSISPVSFKPLAGSAVLNTMATRPADYPLYDFYGTAIPASGVASGAVQTAAGSGYYLDYGAVNGTVSIAGGSAVPDGDGLYGSGSAVTLEAAANSGFPFSHWTVNGVRQGPQTPPEKITLTMDGHKTVRAICSRSITVNSAEDSGTGSLREALINAADYDLITIASTLTGETITLTSRLPDINKIITIEGNGVILSGSGITQIMNIAGGEVSIRRVHFRDGTTTNLGGAIVVAGTLNLESCIFSGNRATSRNGGAIYTYGTLTVSGCTFYGNTANSTSSAIYNNSGMLTLTGNLFYGNTASGGYNVVYSPGTTINSGSYNVSDYASGTNITTGSGWTFDTTDQQVTGITFDGAFTPSSATNLKIITPSLPTGFPATYFDGSPRDVPATPGAMAAAP